MRTSHVVSSRPRPVVLLAVCLIAAALPRPLAAESPPNALSAAERRAGWRLLFDGTSADAFRGYRKDALPAGWAVEDGAIVRKEKGAGDIVTKDAFGEFELQLEYRITPGGNSGVMFHVTEDEKAPWMTGPEVQINDNAAGHDPQKAGWLYALYEPPPARPKPDPTKPAAAAPDPQAAPLPPVDATRPAGEWNHLYLRVVPGSGEVCVNGVRYYQFKKGDKDWDARVAKSKFAKFPAFGKADRGHVCLQDHGDLVAFRSIKVRELASGAPTKRPEDGTAAVKAVPAFPDVAWEGWSAETDSGKPAEPLRPLQVTHAGDGSGRRFVLDQSGMIHVVPRDGRAAKLFLDLRAKTRRWSGKGANEEGLLGVAFHPRFRENGEFFVCYSRVADEGRPEQISRFRVRRDDPDRADPASEETVLVMEQPFSNHNGGSIVFGNDGFLYLGLGDGGNQRDPLGHGQNTATWFGSVLRIDVDRRDPGKGYAVPADNPLVNVADARPEIYAWGFRNPWQLSCDRATGRVWAADVGEDLWEEINVVEKGGNYGWSIREGTKAFGPRGAGERTVDPVWEYDHQIGKSITGGFVYRGSELPELVGKYLYGDYVSGRLWGVDIDAAGGPVNLAIPWDGRPIFGFGCDEAGEAYVTTSSPTGQGVMRLVRDAAASAR